MPGISVAINAFNNTRAALRQFNSDTGVVAARLKAVSGAGNAAAGAMDTQGRSTNRLREQNRRLGVSFTQLLFLMAKFGIAMQIITFPSRVISALGGAVQATEEWETALRQTNTILRLNDDQLSVFSNRMLGLTIATGGTKEMMQATFEAAQQLVGLNMDPLRQQFRTLTEESQAVFDIVNVAQRGAIASQGNVGEITNALSQVASLLNVPTSNLSTIMDMLFRAQELGDIRVGGFAKNIGEILPLVEAVSSGDPTRALEEFNGALALLATMSQSLGTEASFTAFRRFQQVMIGTTDESDRYRNALKELGVDFSLTNLKAKGIIATFQELQGILPDSALMDRFIANNQELVDVQGEVNTRFATYLKIIRGLSPNIRSAKGIQALLVGEGRILNETLEKQVNFVGAADDAFQQMTRTLGFAKSRFMAAGNAIRIAFGIHILPAISEMSNLIADFVSNIVTDENFQQMNLPQKVFAFMNNFNAQFSAWYTSGGKSKIQGTAQEIGFAFAEFLAGAMGRDSANIYAQAGRDAFFSFMRGFSSLVGLPGGQAGIIDSTRNFVGGVGGRGIAGGILGRSLLGGGLRGTAIGAAAGAISPGLSERGGLLQTGLDALTVLMLAKGGLGLLRGGGRLLGGSRLAAGGITGMLRTQGVRPVAGSPTAQYRNIAGGRYASRPSGTNWLGIGTTLGAGALTGSMFGPWGAAIGLAGASSLLAWDWWKNRNRNDTDILPQVADQLAMSPGASNFSEFHWSGDINVYPKDEVDANQFIANLAELLDNAQNVDNTEVPGQILRRGLDSD